MFGKESIWFQPTLESEFVGLRTIDCVPSRGRGSCRHRAGQTDSDGRHPAEGHERRDTCAQQMVLRIRIIWGTHRLAVT